MIFQHVLMGSLRSNGARTAIELPDRAVPFNEIIVKADKITRHLLQAGLKKETMVGILMADRVDLICSIIGVANARCVFVPIDGRLPEARLATIIDDNKIGYIISRTSDLNLLRRRPAEVEYFDFDIIQKSSVQSAIEYPSFEEDDSLYVFFTSGSTGRPKGIVGRNSSLLQFLTWEINAFNINGNSRFSQFISPYFDAFLRDVFVPMLTGGTICIPPSTDDLFTAENMRTWINKSAITSIHCVPSLFRVIAGGEFDKSDFQHLEHVFMSGEKINPPELKSWFSVFDSRVALYNFYGATETTMIRTFYRISAADVNKTRIPIGVPIDDTELLISRKDFKPCPTLVPGELYIISPFLSKGYLNAPTLTTERFITLPSGKTAFKTGDQARKLADGSIELLGREDRQIKIRGIRVDLEEVESTLLQSSLLRNAVVVQRSDDPDQLNAFVINNGTHSDNTDLNERLSRFLETRLPLYMIPSGFITLDQYPLLPNGKINLRALANHSTTMEKLVLPENEMQSQLLDVWKEILGEKPISIDAAFHRIGGNSLTIMSLIGKIDSRYGVKLTLSDLFKNPTIRKQAELVVQSRKEQVADIPVCAEKKNYILSSAQRRLFVLHQFDKSSIAYNMPHAIRLQGSLDLERLQYALQKLIETHESLRTSFVIERGEPRQIIAPTVSFSLDFLTTSLAEVDSVLTQFIRPFDLSVPPLFRAVVVELSTNDHLLVTDMHHIISDGVSLGILTRDFMKVYNGNEIIRPKIRYRDFAEWMQAPAQIEAVKNERQFWLNEFSNGVPVLELPADRQRPPIKDYRGSLVEFEIGKETTEKLKSIASNRDVTMFMIMLTAFDIMLSKLSGSGDVVVGVPVAGRNRTELEDIVGMFVNMLPIRTSVAGSASLASLLNDVKARTLSCLEKQNYPYEQLIDDLSIKRDLSRNPLFDTVLSFQNFSGTSMPMSDIELESFKRQHTMSKFDLTLYGHEADGKLYLRFEYSTQIFVNETVLRFAEYFKNILSAIATDIEQRIADVQIFGWEEQTLLLEQCDFSDAEHPFETVIDIFDRQAARSPDRIAVKCDEDFLTYRELSKKVNAVAHLLRQNGVVRNNIVGLLMPRSIDTIIGILATLKAGAAYLPIDVEYPDERIQYLLEDSKASVLLTSKGTDYVPLQLPTVYVEDAPTLEAPINNINEPSDLCYIIYTSGTTGLPKGVMVEHINVVRLFFHKDCRFDFGDNDVWTMFHSPSFDFSVWEIFGALLFGGKLIIIPKMVARDTHKFLDIVDREDVTILNQTPSAFYNFSREAILRSPDLALRYVVFGGEALDPKKLRTWMNRYPDIKLINMFGITETTVHVTYKEIRGTDIDTGVSNIGVPIPTLSVIILDQDQKLAPLGVIGELYVGGKGVARGYLGKEKLTQEKFVPNPYDPKQRLYRSGDLARILPSGDLEYLGRIDHQVKIRGFRIELGEIEGHVRNFPGMKETVVGVSQVGGNSVLVCYYTAGNKLDDQDIRSYLMGKLPEHMVPSFYVQVETFQLTGNGKLDRKALPAPVLSKSNDFIGARNSVETKLVELWSAVLGIGKESISITKSFFELGGDSLKIVQLATAINEQLKWNISIPDLFRYTTISSLAKIASERTTDTNGYNAEAKEEVLGMQDVLNSVNR